jgi:RNA polymerase sigma-70 factor (ECF subfamily)
MAEDEKTAQATGAETDPDAKLVERLKAGDSKALDELFRRHRDSAYGIAYRLLGNAEDALDVVQEAFIHVMRGIDSFRAQSTFRTWMYRIVTHAALDYRRYRAVRSSGSLDTETSAEPAATGPSNPAPDEEAQTRDLRIAINRALENVSEKNRAALVLYAEEGLSYKEVAEVLGISVGTVMSRIFNARQRLKELLADEIG